MATHPDPVGASAPAPGIQIEQEAEKNQGQMIAQMSGGLAIGQFIIVCLSGYPPSESVSPPKDSIKTWKNPYKGLGAFQETDGDRFFGRDTQIDDLWKKFQQLYEDESATRLLMIYGPSGSGKSSLARAGLIPELERNPLLELDRARVAVLVPGDNPLGSLAMVLARFTTNDLSPVEKANEFERVLMKTAEDGQYEGLWRIADALPEISAFPLIVLVDQLEEIFTFCENAAKRDAFIGNLLNATTKRSKRVSAIVTLRSEFLGKHPRLTQLIQQGYFVPAMDANRLRDAITEPAKLAGHSFDQSTVSLLIKDTEGREGALPLLQFALTQIWDGMAEGKEPAETLEIIGGVGGALAGEAQRIYESLTSEEQKIARRVFIKMVQFGEGTENTRRRVELKKVISCQDNFAQVQSVVARFSAPRVRLITCAGDSDTTVETLEVTHETLFSHWSNLRTWIAEDRDPSLQQRKIETWAEEWIAKEKQKDYLIQGSRLKEAKKFQKNQSSNFPFSIEVVNYINQSSQHRLNNFIKPFTIALIIAVIISIFFGITDFQKKARIKELWQKVEAQNNNKRKVLGRINEIQELAKAGENLPKRIKTLFFVDLSGANFENVDLSKISFFGCNLNNANLHGANLSGSSFVALILKRLTLAILILAVPN
jgi:hypothetical protein